MKRKHSGLFMTVLIIGGSGSGKSELAENLSVAFGCSKLYVATMMPYGDEAQARIERHRQMRKYKGFDGIDCYTDIKSVCTEEYDTVLIECMSNLVANEMFSHVGDITRIKSGIADIMKKFKNTVIVSNDVFGDGDEYSAETLDYIYNIGDINSYIAKHADAVIEVAASIPIIHKGREKIESIVRGIGYSFFNVQHNPDAAD